MPLSLSDANKVIEKGHAWAAQIGVKVTVAVVDEGGLLIALGRMDGAAPLSPQLAEAKAVGAAMLLRDGGALAQMAQDRPSFFNAADRLVRVPLIPGLGSLPIKLEGKIVGAVGVSGARPEQDLECAEAGLRQELRED
jgi:glc operon protein GlcG